MMMLYRWFGGTARICLTVCLFVIALVDDGIILDRKDVIVSIVEYLVLVSRRREDDRRDELLIN